MKESIVKRSKSESEFGGRSGLVQALADGHTPTPHEELMSLYATDPSDPAAVPGVENIGERDRTWKDSWANEDGTPGTARIG